MIVQIQKKKQVDNSMLYQILGRVLPVNATSSLVDLTATDCVEGSFAQEAGGKGILSVLMSVM